MDKAVTFAEVYRVIGGTVFAYATVQAVRTWDWDAVNLPPLPAP